MRRLGRVATFVAVLVQTLQHLDGQASTVRPLSEVDREAFIQTGWKSGIPADETGVRRTFSNPVSQRREKLRNRHVPGQIDEIVTLRYSGFEISYYKTPTVTFVTHLTVTSPVCRCGMAFELQYGSLEQGRF